MTAPLPTSHLLDHALGHVRDTLAADERVGELGLDVSVDIERVEARRGATGEGQTGEVETVVVRGVVSTAHRKEGIASVVSEVLLAHGCPRPVRDDTTVAAAAAPPLDDVESL